MDSHQNQTGLCQRDPTPPMPNFKNSSLSWKQVSVIPSVAVDLCGRLRPSFHPAACSACSPSLSWERKLLHCGPLTDRRDPLAHYLFISVLHLWLPRGSRAQIESGCTDCLWGPETWTRQPDGQMHATGNTSQQLIHLCTIQRFHVTCQ